MSINSLRRPEHIPQPESDQVAAASQQFRAESRRQHVSEDELKGVSVEGSQADGSGVLVVLLVDQTVEVPGVQETVAEVEGQIFH